MQGLSSRLSTERLARLGRSVTLGSLGPLPDLPFTIRTLAGAGVIRPVRPDKLARFALELRRWGTSPAAGIAIAAIEHPDETMIEDEAGSLTFGEVHLRSNALARALADEGVGEGDGIAVMCRNHRGFIETTLAAAKLGANGLYMNTAFSAPQLVEVMEREEPVALVYDEEFAGLLEDAAEDLRRFIAWRDDGSDSGDEGEPEGDGSDEEGESSDDDERQDEGQEDGEQDDGGEDEEKDDGGEDEEDGDEDGKPRKQGPIDSSDTPIEEMIEATDDSDLDPPDESSRFVILTSGTTGTPKGAQRGQPDTLGPLAAMFSRIPLRARETTMIAAPLFHSWGFAHFSLGLSLSSGYVLRRKFDPEGTLKAVAESGATALVVVPVMMQRILQLPQETLDRYDLPELRVTAASGSALPGELATKWMDTFGDNLYNLYGSTEVAWASIATPEDLRKAPGTAGRTPRGTVVRIVDEDGNDVSPGDTGRVFVGNEMAFEGYTGGGGKDELDGLLSSGDVGHFDDDGRLFIDGRDDEMIVSGGENVFPREVEDLLADRDDVKEVAVIGVDDEEFGQRLKAFVVSEGSEPSEDELKKHVKSNLAGYKVPREIEFLDSLPRNSTGKVLKRELT